MERLATQGRPYRDPQEHTSITKEGQREVFTVKLRNSPTTAHTTRCEPHQQPMRRVVNRQGLTKARQLIIAVAQRTLVSRKANKTRSAEETPHTPHLEKTAVFPGGPTLREPPTGGGHPLQFPHYQSATKQQVRLLRTHGSVCLLVSTSGSKEISPQCNAQR